jgi:hypothetical protein
MSKTENTPWTLNAVLEAWGMRYSGSPLTNPDCAATGNAFGADFEAQAMIRVMLTKGYHRAFPALHWVYVEGKPIQSFQIGRYSGGVFGVQAFPELGWFDLRDHCPHHAAKMVLGQFQTELSIELRSRPFVPINGIPVRDAMEIAEEINQKGISGA